MLIMKTLGLRKARTIQAPRETSSAPLSPFVGLLTNQKYFTSSDPQVTIPRKYDVKPQYSMESRRELFGTLQYVHSSLYMLAW